MSAGAARAAQVPASGRVGRASPSLAQSAPSAFCRPPGRAPAHGLAVAEGVGGASSSRLASGLLSAIGCSSSSGKVPVEVQWARRSRVRPAAAARAVSDSRRAGRRRQAHSSQPQIHPIAPSSTATSRRPGRPGEPGTGRVELRRSRVSRAFGRHGNPSEDRRESTAHARLACRDRQGVHAIPAPAAAADCSPANPGPAPTSRPAARPDRTPDQILGLPRSLGQQDSLAQARIGQGSAGPGSPHTAGSTRSLSRDSFLSRPDPDPVSSARSSPRLVTPSIQPRHNRQGDPSLVRQPHSLADDRVSSAFAGRVWRALWEPSSSGPDCRRVQASPVVD
jgi:hypothetical protein